MGCCASSDRSSYSPSSPTKTKDSQPPRSSISRLKVSENRAPPSVEEETVKEVLSEIPKWKPILPKFEPEKPIFEKLERESTKPFFKADEISEVSEVCSLSESMSTITDRRDEEEEMRTRGNGSPAKMRKNRSFTGDRREKTVGKSPAKRSDQSPAKRSDQSPAKRNVGSARGFQSRDQMGNMGTKNQPHRRDAGDLGLRQLAPTMEQRDPSWVGVHLQEEQTNPLQELEPPCRRVVAGKLRIQQWRVNGLQQLMNHWKIH